MRSFSRIVLNVLKILMPFMYVRHEFSLSPVREITALDEKKHMWQSEGTDPLYLLIPRRAILPSGWVQLRFSMKTEGDRQTAYLYADYLNSTGEIEETEFFIPVSKKGTVNHIIYLATGLRALRFSPMNGHGIVMLDKVVIHENGWIRKAAIMLRRVLPYLKKEQNYSPYSLRYWLYILKDINSIYQNVSIRRAHQLPTGKKTDDELVPEHLHEDHPMPASFISPDGFANLFDLDEFIRMNPALGEKHMSYWQALEFAVTHGVKQGMPVSSSADDTASFYKELGDQHACGGRLDSAIDAYSAALEFKENDFNIIQHFGDAMLRLGNYTDAAYAYRRALSLNPDSFWSHMNLGICYEHLGDMENAVKSVRNAIFIEPGSIFAWNCLQKLIKEEWGKTQSKADACYRIHNRIEGDTILNKGVERLVQLYKTKSAPLYRKPEKPSVLIIGDPYLPQCVRYRIDQKIEQFASAGINASYTPWPNISKELNRIAFVDVVLFYRVPALPDVIHSIEYSRAAGKIIIYEIDDLVFDSDHYPDRLHSYGGLINRNDYVGLQRGCALFREALRLSDYAIASTEPLARRMATHARSGLAFVHRNGLDSKNEHILGRQYARQKRRYTTIFYGTGTKAHNSDFNDLVAPALERILDEFPDVRFKLVGYLTLPHSLKQREKQVSTLPLISDMDAYMALLGSADINIAPLHSSPVNDCKSELKWFEAGVFGIPSVVSATENYLAVVKDGEDALVARTPEEWYEKLRQLITDKDLRKRIGQQAKAVASERYSINALGKNLAGIIRRITEHHNQGAVDLAHRKKIVIVNVFFPPQSIGGATRVVADNVSILVERYKNQFDIEIFTSDNDNPDPYQIRQYSIMGVRVTKVSTPQKPGMDWEYNDEKVGAIFSEFLDYARPDIVHFHCIQRLTGSIVVETQKRAIPYFITVHDAWWISDYQFLVDEQGNVCDIHQTDPDIVSRQSSNIAKTLKRQTYLMNCLHMAEKVLAVSKTFTKIYEVNGFSNVAENSNGIMPRIWPVRTPSPDGRVRIGHIGGMSKHKGFHLLKEALGRGDFSNLEALAVDLSKPHGYKKRDKWGNVPVTFVGRYPQDKIGELYSIMDVLAAPSIWPESFGLVTREAVAAGVWVIASDRGAIGEHIIENENGHIVTVDDDSGLFSILERIDSNPKRYLAQHNRRDVVSVYDQVAQLVEYYNSVLHKTEVTSHRKDNS